MKEKVPVSWRDLYRHFNTLNPQTMYEFDPKNWVPEPIHEMGEDVKKWLYPDWLITNIIVKGEKATGTTTFGFRLRHDTVKFLPRKIGLIETNLDLENIILLEPQSKEQLKKGPVVVSPKKVGSIYPVELAVQELSSPYLLRQVQISRIRMRRIEIQQLLVSVTTDDLMDYLKCERVELSKLRELEVKFGKKSNPSLDFLDPGSKWGGLLKILSRFL